MYPIILVTILINNLYKVYQLSRKWERKGPWATQLIWGTVPKTLVNFCILFLSFLGCLQNCTLKFNVLFYTFYLSIEIPEPTQRIPHVHIWMHPIKQTSEFSLVCNLMKYKINLILSQHTYQHTCHCFLKELIQLKEAPRPHP